MNPLLTLLLLIASLSIQAAEEIVPHTIRSITSVSADFLELMGPGKMVVKGKNHHYRKGKYIRVRNIDSLSEVEGINDVCILHYTSHDHSVNITVRQSCKNIINIIATAQQSPDPSKLKIKIPTLGKSQPQ